MRWIIVVVLGGCASSALGQQTQTDCYSLGGHTVCRQQTQPDYGAALYNAFRKRPPQIVEPAPPNDDDLNKARGRAAGEMIAAGECGQARDMALRAGDFTLVEQIKVACAK